MVDSQLQQVRRFNRLVTQRVGALENSYLRRGRPLGEARLMFEIGVHGAEARALRARLGLDSGYLSRLLQSLKAQGLVEVVRQERDGRRRGVNLTAKGRAELSIYDRLSDKLAASILAPLDAAQRGRLATAMEEVMRLFWAASVEIAPESPQGPDARACLDAYFQELASRFESGLDPRGYRSSELDDMTPPTGLFVVARLDGEPVGCGGLKRTSESVGEIKRVWTAPAARGLGVARRVVRALEAAAGELGLKTIRLDTNRALTEAQAMYRKEGYREIARFNDNPFAHHWFEKDLVVGPEPLQEHGVRRMRRQSAPGPARGRRRSAESPHG